MQTKIVVTKRSLKNSSKLTVLSSAEQDKSRKFDKETTKNQKIE